MFSKTNALKISIALVSAYFTSLFLVKSVFFPSDPIVRFSFKMQTVAYFHQFAGFLTSLPKYFSRQPTSPPQLVLLPPPAIYHPSPGGRVPKRPSYQPTPNIPRSRPSPTSPPEQQPSPTQSIPVLSPTPNLEPTRLPTMTPLPTSLPTSPPTIIPANPGPPLSNLLTEINKWRQQAGNEPLTYTPQAGIEGMNRYLADLAPHLIQEGSCHHGIGEPARLGWDYVREAGYQGNAHGEVLMCPGLCTPVYAAQAWWENGNGPHKEILYDDRSIRYVACGYYEWNGNQARMWGCVTYSP